MPTSSDRIPSYLLFFFLQIRSHAGEVGYLTERIDKLGLEDACIETQMVEMLYKRGLITLSDKKLDKVYDPLCYSPAPGVTVHKAGTEYIVHYWGDFGITPAGKYLLREMAFSAVGKTAWTAIVAAIGIIIGLLVNR